MIRDQPVFKAFTDTYFKSAERFSSCLRVLIHSLMPTFRNQPIHALLDGFEISFIKDTAQLARHARFPRGKGGSRNGQQIPIPGDVHLPIRVSRQIIHVLRNAYTWELSG